jgi:hypothetical protein
MNPVDRQEAVSALLALYPKCRDAGMQLSSDGCSCWVGVLMAVQALEEL